MKRNTGRTMLSITISSTVFLSLAVFAVAQEESAANAQYSVVALDALGGVLGSSAHGINNKGWVTGDANLTGDTTEHASLWRNGVVTDLGALGGSNSNVDFPVKNDRGLIAGFAQTSTTDPLGEHFCIFICTPDGQSCEGSNQSCRGFLWRDGVISPLPTLGGNNSAATGVNNRGVIVGAAENSTQDPNCLSPQVLDYEAVTWSAENGDTHQLPAFAGDSVAAGAAINDEGQVVGGSGNCGSGPGISPILIHAVLWQNDSVTDLGSLGGVMNNLANAINNRGQVVGMSDLAGDNTGHAFLWQNGAMKDLGTLPGDFSSVAFGINNKGQVVGISCDVNFNCRGFLWENGVMTDLNTLIPPDSSLYLLYGADIDDAGKIVGQALDQTTGAVPAFLATPTNEHGRHPSAKLILPESVRERLQQRRGFGRFRP